FDFLKSGGTPGSGSPDNKELSMEMRLLLAFVLMGLVLFTTPYFFKSPPAPPPTKKVDSAAAPTPAQPKPSETATAAGTSGPSSVEQVSAQKEETFTLETDVYRIVFWNRGAVAQSWILKKYKDSANKPLEVINTAAGPVTGFPFRFDFKNQ